MKVSEARTKYLEMLDSWDDHEDYPRMAGRNPHYNSDYVTLWDLHNWIKPRLSKRGFVLEQPTALVDGEWCVHNRISVVETGDVVAESWYPIVISDNPQKTSGSLTYAQRVSLLSLIAIRSESDMDGQEGAEEARPPARREEPREERERPARRQTPSGGGDDKPFRWKESDLEGPATCKKCGEEGFWITTKKGKSMIVNKDRTAHFKTCPKEGGDRSRDEEEEAQRRRMWALANERLPNSGDTLVHYLAWKILEEEGGVTVAFDQVSLKDASPSLVARVVETLGNDSKWKKEKRNFNRWIDREVPF